MVESNLAQLRHKVRWAVEPDNPQLITHWLARERCCNLRSISQAPCGCCSTARQRRRYHFQFQLLLGTVLDDLLPAHWRCSCLDHIYKPLCGLKQLCDNPAREAHVRRLYQELAISSRYVQAGLVH